MRVADKFERLLEMHSRQDGHPWTEAELQRATNSVVTRSYVTNLRKGRIVSPGHEKMEAIAKAMGFPPALWFDEGLVEESETELDAGLVAALRDETVRETVREISRLPGRERRMVLGIVRQFGGETESLGG